MNGQDRYHAAEKKAPKKPAVFDDSLAGTADEYRTKEDWLTVKDVPITYLTIEEAALQSGLSPQAISRYAMRGNFGECRRAGGMVRIPEKHFQEWLKERQEGEKARGIH